MSGELDFEPRGTVARVTGVQDLLVTDLERLLAIQKEMGSIFARHGYQAIDTPILESAELYLRKSGGELASRLYTLTDPGGHRLALRPEFTASVIRVFVERGNSLSLPLRWQYAGPVFRYEPAGQGLRQFTQCGAELIGAAGPEADAEVISLADAALKGLGLQRQHIVLGHWGALTELLSQTNVSERARYLLLSHLGQLQDEPNAQEVRDLLLKQAIFVPGLTSEMEEAELQRLLADISGGGGGPVVGSRSVEEIAERYLRKLKKADTPERLEMAWAFLRELCQLKGEPREVLSLAETLVKRHSLDPGPLRGVGEVVEALRTRGVGAPLILDLGLARGLAYYTGVTFEIHHPSLAGEPRICGGGRYDGLVRALGGDEVPALGFAFGVERVVDAIQSEGIVL